MKLEGFVNGAYTLDSVNVDAQRCVNLYPEAIESGTGKGAQRGYLRPTPGLELITTIGDGPIRMVHKDANNRVLIASGDRLYRYADDVEKDFDLWSDTFETTYWMRSSTSRTDIANDKFWNTAGSTPDYFYTGLVVKYEVTSGSGPSVLTSGNNYYLVVLDDTYWGLAANASDASTGTLIDLTDAGTTGVFEFTPQLVDQQLTIKHTQIDFDTNQITIAGGHLFNDGDRVYVGSHGCELPGLTHFFDGDSTFTYYYVKTDSSTVFRLCTSLANVVADTEVDLTTTSNVGKVSVNSFIDPDETFNTIFEAHVQFDTSTGRVTAASSNPGNIKYTAYTVICDGKLPLVIDGGIYKPKEKTTAGFWGAGTVGYMVHKDGDVYYSGGTTYDIAFSDATHVDWIDGYFILSKTGDANFYVSGFNDPTTDPLSFAQAEGSPDRIVGIISNRRDLWVFNEKTTEVFVNTGNSDFPFERVQSGFVEIGCVAENSINKIEGTVFWLGRSDHGEGVVYMGQSLQPQRISTHAIEQAISGYADLTTATSYTYHENGHKFYVLNFAEATWVYDMSTGLWHERAYTNAGTLERHRGEHHCFNFNSREHLVSDYSTTSLYKFVDTEYEDNSGTITRLRTIPHFSNENNQIYWHELWLDMETGVGLVSGQGSDPQVMLDWSDDGGHTWSDESWTSAGGQSGGIGEYSTRVRWRRLGRSRDRIYRFKITDPVKTILIDAAAKVSVGVN